MPGVGTRACSSSTNVFQAARSGRGSAVTITVSSTSEMMPNVAFGSTMKTGASKHAGRLGGGQPDGVPARGELNGDDRVDHAAAVRSSPRGVLPSISTVTVDSATGTLMNDRQPRMLSSRLRCRRSARLPGRGSFASTTRPRMRAQVGASVAGVRHHGREEAALAGAPRAELVERVLDARGAVHDRLDAGAASVG